MGNKKKPRQQTPTRTEPMVFQEEGDYESVERRVKRSVSFSGTRRLNPFSILPDYDSDRNGDFDSEEDSFIPPKRGRQSSLSMSSIQQSAAKAQVNPKPTIPRKGSLQSLNDMLPPSTKNRLLTSQSLTGLSNLLNLGNSNITQIHKVIEPAQFNDPDETESKRSMASSKKAKKQKKKKGASETLKMYDEKNEETKLPTPDEINEIFHHLNEARTKMFQASVRFWTYIAVKSLALIVILIQLILLVLKYIWIVLSTIFYHIMRVIFSAFPFLNSLLLHKHDHKDPFKRTLAPSGSVVGYSNANLNTEVEFQSDDRNNEYNEYDSNRKQFYLALDLDETLIYTIPMTQDNGKKGKIKEIELQQEDEEEVRVFHPSSKQEQVFKLRKRPHLDMFLLEMSKLFNLIVYSSAPKQYVDAMVDSIDSNKLIKKRLYRDHCIKCPGIYIKDLQHVGEIQQTIILDCVAEATKLDSENAIIIKKFRGERTDSELMTFSKILAFIATDSIKKSIPLSTSLHDFKGTYL